MSNATRWLVDAGLTEGESRVYMALLKTGPSTVGPIVKESGVAYSNIYEILQRLASKGMASFVTKNRIRHYQAAPPENLMDYIEKNESKLLQQKKSLADSIEGLKSLQTARPSQNAEIFTGIKGLKSAYIKMTSDTNGSEWLFFYIHKPEHSKESDLFYKSISEWFKSQKIKNRGVCNREYASSRFAKKAKFLKIRYADFPIPANIDIFGSKVMIVSWNPSPVAFLIESEEIANSMKEYFEEAWREARQSTSP